MKDALLAVLMAICVAAFVYTYATPAEAAPATKAQEAGCVQFATVGTIGISHCISPNGNEFEANTAGMMIPGQP